MDARQDARRRDAQRAKITSGEVVAHSDRVLIAA